MSLLLGILVAAIVLFIAFGPIVRRGAPRIALEPSTFRDRSGRLEFRHPHLVDIDELETLYTDPEAQAANQWDDASVDQMLATLHDRRRFEPWARTSMVGVRRRDDVVVGLATLSTEDSDGRSGLSIGLQMLPQYRGEGLATELLAAMIAATRALSDGEIWIGTATNNDAIIHMMDSLGYEPEPGSAPYTAPNGTKVDAHWYQVGAGAPEPDFQP
ncbi:MAG: GNAT family N-acetyltransferase [Actinomycetota bacterium]